MNMKTPTIIQYLAIGENTENRVYIIMFESPEVEWESNWRYAKPMLNMFGPGK